MMLVTEADVVAKLRGHRLYKANFVTYIQLFESGSSNGLEKKYFQYLKTFDLGTGFYFSDTYDLTNSFQTNTVAQLNQQDNRNENSCYSYCHSEPIKYYNHLFMWNYYTILEFHKLLRDKRWVVAFIHGYIEQIKVQKLLLAYQIILIAKRSRYHAGTRYLTRGLNPDGFVGNFVETEQIVLDLNKGAIAAPTCSSFVQVRGSAPIYWFQETKVVAPKPPINVNPSFDIFFDASKKHFADLYSLYGPLIFVLNLVKKNESTKREQFLTEEYQRALDSVNKDLPNDLKIIYYHQDMKALLKRDKEEFLNLTNSFAYVSLSKTGFFTARRETQQNGESKLIPLTFQKGVIRSSCVDCLDRTNTFQQLVGETALSLQIAKLYHIDNSQTDHTTHIDNSVLLHFREMFGRMGDVISLQYGGSIAHRSSLASKTASNQLEFVTSIKRYYSNTFIDQNKQNAINLFLGIHKAVKDGIPIWEVNNPIVLAPNMESLKRLLPPQKWWEGPLNKFHSTIIINNDIEITNKVLNQKTVKSPNKTKNQYLDKVRQGLLIGNTDSKSFNEKLDSDGSLYPQVFTDKSHSTNRQNQPSSQFSGSSEKGNGEEIELDDIGSVNRNDTLKETPSDKKGEKKKVHWQVGAFFKLPVCTVERRATQTELVSSVHFRSNSMVETGIFEHEEVPKVPEKLTDVSKKMKKLYNNVLLVDEKQEDSDEEYEVRQRGMTTRNRAATKVVSISSGPTISAKEKRLFADYCSIGKNVDNNERLLENILKGNEPSYNEKEVEEEMKAYCSFENWNNCEENFPKTIKEYIKYDSEGFLFAKGVEERESVNFELDPNFKLENDIELKVDAKHAQNLKSMKNMITTLYPNLQKPNITKI